MRSVLCPSMIAASLLSLAGCGPDKPVSFQTVYVTPEHHPPIAQRECHQAAPPFPRLPERDVLDDDAVRDRIAIATNALLPADQDMAAHIDKVRAPHRAKLEEKLAVSEGPLYRRGNFNGTGDQLLVDALLARPDLTAAWQSWWRAFLDDTDPTPLLADLGFAPRTAFISDLGQRLRIVAGLRRGKAPFGHGAQFVHVFHLVGGNGKHPARLRVVHGGVQRAQQGIHQALQRAA